ncbi:MAG TPA: hypothetical protein DCR14_17430, partial [Acidimicrobiaceae bacterium]|nr:hypothetical protein [Acidimicrobiaceae bacterium]
MADRRRYERDLFHDLTTFRVETLVLAESGTRLVLPSPVRRGTPPTSPEQLIEEVAVAGALWVRSATNDRVTGFENREFDADELYRLAQTAEQMARSTRNPEVRAVRAPEVDPEVAARQAQALRLAAALRETALGSRFRRGRARGFSGGAARVEHRAMRQLARHWELGSRTVWGRTVMRMDGDTTTVFRPHTSESDAIQAAHIRIATAAMDHWQFLLSAFNDVLVLLASFLRRTTWRPSLPRRRHIDRRAQQPSVQRLSPRELLGRLVRLFGIGRVVFESVGSSGACEIRTMVVASGDVEVSIRDSSVEGHVLITHIET